MSEINNPVNVSYVTPDDIMKYCGDFIITHPVTQLSFNEWSPGNTVTVTTDTPKKSGYRIGSADNGVYNSNIMAGAHAKLEASIKIGDNTAYYTIYGKINEYRDEELNASMFYFGKVIVNTSTGTKTIGYTTDAAGEYIDSKDGIIGFAWGDPRLVGAPTAFFLEFTTGPQASSISFISANLYFEDLYEAPNLDDIECYLFKINNFNNIKSMYIDTCAQIYIEDFYKYGYGYYGCQIFTNTINIPYEEYSAEQIIVNFPEYDLIPTLGSVTRAVLKIGISAFTDVEGYEEYNGEYRPYLIFKLGNGCYPRFINFNYVAHNQTAVDTEFEGDYIITSEPSLQIISLLSDSHRTNKKIIYA